MQPLKRSWLSAGIDSMSHAARVLVFASPKRKFRDPTKLNRSCKSLVVPPFSQNELLEMQVTHSPQFCYICIGPCAKALPALLLACFHCSRHDNLAGAAAEHIWIAKGPHHGDVSPNGRCPSAPPGIHVIPELPGHAQQRIWGASGRQAQGKSCETVASKHGEQSGNDRRGPWAHYARR